MSIWPPLAFASRLGSLIFSLPYYIFRLLFGFLWVFQISRPISPTLCAFCPACAQRIHSVISEALLGPLLQSTIFSAYLDHPGLLQQGLRRRLFYFFFSSFLNFVPGLVSIFPVPGPLTNPISPTRPPPAVFFCRCTSATQGAAPCQTPAQLAQSCISCCSPVSVFRHHHQQQQRTQSNGSTPLEFSAPLAVTSPARIRQQRQQTRNRKKKPTAGAAAARLELPPPEPARGFKHRDAPPH